MESQLKTYFSQLAKWQKINGVFWTVGVVILVLCGLIFIILGGKMGPELEQEFGGSIGIRAIGILYALMGLLYYFPAKYLLSSAKKIKEWVASDDETALTEGVLNSKSFFKFTGVLAIICFGIVLLVMLIAAIGAIVAL